MSRTLFTGIGWAVEKQTIAANTTTTGPVLVSAVSTSPNSVRLTFDRALQLEYRMFVPPGGYRAKTLDISSYQIAKVVGGAPLTVVRTVWVDSTHVDLLTENQEAVSYRVTTVAGGVMDFWGNLITEQTADFTGLLKSDYTTPSTLRAFTSGYAGMQEDTPSEIYPDLEAPYLQNLNPANSSVDKNPAGNIYLEIRDDDEGVNLSTVNIWIDGTLAYNGSSFQSPYNGPGSSVVLVGPAYQFTFDPTFTFPEYYVVLVHVHARDLAPIPNELEATYSFRTWDHTAPFVDAHTPTGTGISQNTLVTFSVDETSGSGVDLSSMNVLIDGASAIIGGSFRPGFDGPFSAIVPHGLGYNVTIQKTSPYPSYDYATINVYAEDNEGNGMTYIWNFRVEDYLGPFVEPLYPLNGDVDIPGNCNISLKVSDLDSVIASSIRVNIDKGEGFEPVFDWTRSPKFYPGWDGPASTYSVGGGEYTIVIDPTTDFTVASLVQVEVLATDPTGNPARI